MAELTAANYYSSTWTIGAIEIVTDTDKHIYAAFPGILPPASLHSCGAAFRLVYRLASRSSFDLLPTSYIYTH